MKIVIIGSAGFIGTNLAIKLAKDNDVYAVDNDIKYFEYFKKNKIPRLSYRVDSYNLDTNFDVIVQGMDIVYHLASTNIPGESNRYIPDELESNIIVTAKLLDACVRQHVKKIIFISSGGTVYGKENLCPIKEDMLTYPISSYGIQKLAIEKLLYLYQYQQGLDYRVIRLSNPYGPHQKPNGKLGVITTFIYKALKDEELNIYGDGTIVRDFIYIDDAIKGIINIANGKNQYKEFNIGSGIGTSINDIISIIKDTLKIDVRVNYIVGRIADVPVNYLDINRYETYYGKLNSTDLSVGILRTSEYLKKVYCI